MKLPPLQETSPFGARLRRLLLPLTLVVLLLLAAFAAWVVEEHDLEIGRSAGVDEVTGLDETPVEPDATR